MKKKLLLITIIAILVGTMSIWSCITGKNPRFEVLHTGSEGTLKLLEYSTTTNWLEGIIHRRLELEYNDGSKVHNIPISVGYWPTFVQEKLLPELHWIGLKPDEATMNLGNSLELNVYAGKAATKQLIDGLSEKLEKNLGPLQVALQKSRAAHFVSERTTTQKLPIAVWKSDSDGSDLSPVFKYKDVTVSVQSTGETKFRVDEQSLLYKTLPVLENGIGNLKRNGAGFEFTVDQHYSRVFPDPAIRASIWEHLRKCTNAAGVTFTDYYGVSIP